MFVSQAYLATWSPLILCAIPSQTKGNSGSSLILMKDDAWQASVLSRHQGSCRGGRGCLWCPEPPVTGFLLSIREVHTALTVPAQASVSTLPLRVRSPGDLDILCSRAGRRGDDCSSFLRIPGVHAAGVRHAHLLGNPQPPASERSSQLGWAGGWGGGFRGGKSCGGTALNG